MVAGRPQPVVSRAPTAGLVLAAAASASSSSKAEGVHHSRSSSGFVRPVGTSAGVYAQRTVGRDFRLDTGLTSFIALVRAPGCLPVPVRQQKRPCPPSSRPCCSSTTAGPSSPSHSLPQYRFTLSALLASSRSVPSTFPSPPKTKVRLPRTSFRQDPRLHPKHQHAQQQHSASQY